MWDVNLIQAMNDAPAISLKPICDAVIYVQENNLGGFIRVSTARPLTEKEISLFDVEAFSGVSVGMHSHSCFQISYERVYAGKDVAAAVEVILRHIGLNNIFFHLSSRGGREEVGETLDALSPIN